MKKIGFVAVLIVVLTFAACTEKDYTCNCAIDAPEVTGVISLDSDTNLMVTARSEKEAEIQCNAAEEASSILSSQYDGIDATITCELK